MNIVLFNEEEIDRPLAIRDARAKHIRKVLHKGLDESFEAGIVNGDAGTAHITKIDEHFLYFTFEAAKAPEPLYPLILLIGFPRPIQLKRLLRDVASLGVCELHLLYTELGEKSYMQSTLVERGAALESLLEGAMQAKSTVLPTLYMHKSLDECLQFLQQPKYTTAQAPCEKKTSPVVKLVMDVLPPKTPLGDFTANRSLSGKTVIAAIGSERGWTNQERSQFEFAGFTRCGLGERIVRTETAAVMTVSLIACAMGII